MREKNWVKNIFAVLVGLVLLTPFWVFKDLLFPFITSKAYYLRIMVELALPFYLYIVLAYKQYRPNFKNPLTLSLLAFLLFNIVASIFGVNPLKSFWGNFERMGGTFFLAHLVLYYFYILLLGQMRGQYMRRFLVWVIVIAGAVSLEAVMVKITGNHFLFNDPSYPRVSGTFGNPIFIASYLILPMFLTAYYLLVEEKRWLQYIYGAFVILELYVILLSETRGAVVGIVAALFIAMLVYLIQSTGKKVRMWVGIGVACFVVMVSLGFVEHNHFPAGSMLRRVFNLNDSNTQARLIQWKSALEGYVHYPVLGVGPENYYVIANKYYDPKIYQYDPSYFDKPHNHLLEILVTTGAVGFIAYAALMVFFVWSLWRSYKNGLLSLAEMCLVLAGMLAYQIQNLTVFDTVSASLMFFSVAAFGDYLWDESKEGEKEKKNKHEKVLPAGLLNGVAIASAVVVIYVIYLGNATGLQLAKATNYGAGYAAVDPQISKGYFDRAKNLPFDFDPIQVSSKFSDYAVNLSVSPGKQTGDFINQELDDAISFQAQALTKINNDPTAWEELSNLYLSKAIFNKVPAGKDSIDAAQKAIDLAPKRPEPALLMARILIYNNDLAGAIKILLQVITLIPQNASAKMQLALLYTFSGDSQKALPFAEDALALGYQPINANQIEWMGKLYMQNQEWKKAQAIYELALKIDPSGPTALDDYFNLAQIYAKLGQPDRAISLAQAVASADPSRAKEVQAFIAAVRAGK